MVRLRYAPGMVEVRSWYDRGTLMVCFWYAHRCGSGSVRYFNFIGRYCSYIVM